MNNTTPLFILLTSIVFLAEIATDLYVPSLPLLPSEFLTNIEMAQGTMHYHLLGFAIAQPFYGILSDKIGRLELLCLGLAIFCCSSLGCAYSTSIEQLILMRFVQGLGACAGPVLGLAAIKDLSQTNLTTIKAISFITIVLSTAPILGALLGSLIINYTSWRFVFKLLSFLSFIFLIFTLIFLNKDLLIFTKKTHTNEKFLLNLKNGKVKLSCLLFCNALLVSCVWMFLAEGPFLITGKFGSDLTYYGFYQATIVIAYILGSLFTNKMVNANNINIILNTGLTIILSSIFLINFNLIVDQLNLFKLMISLSIFEFGLGIARPPLVDKIMSTYPNHNGAISALLGTSEMAVSFCLLFGLSKLRFYLANPFFFLMSAATISSCLCYLLGLFQKETKVTE